MKIDWTKPVRTKGGESVRILCMDGRIPTHPIVGFRGANTWITSWSKEGEVCLNENKNLTLENVPEEKWLIIWQDPWSREYYPGEAFYPSKAEALKDAGPRAVVCVQIEINEGNEIKGVAK